jgi:hypothetical protein
MTQIRSARPRALARIITRRRFVGLAAASAIAALDTATQRVVRRFAVGRGPNGIAYRAAVG